MKTPHLNLTSKKKKVQHIVGTLLYYAQAIDCTILTALNNTTKNKSKPKENTSESINHLLDCSETHTNAVVRYKASDMVLNVHRNASYLSEQKSQSRVGGHYFLSSRSADPYKKNKNTMNNVPLYTECRVLHHVVASSAEAKFGAIFHNGKTTIPLNTTLE